jgi:hypothetical protein
LGKASSSQGEASVQSMIFLIDHNLKGHALVFFGAIASEGWLDIIPIRFVTFVEMDLSINSDDRVVWRLGQENQMILVTAKNLTNSR